jgi:hypothetical protein
MRAITLRLERPESLDDVMEALAGCALGPGINRCTIRDASRRPRSIFFDSEVHAHLAAFIRPPRPDDVSRTSLIIEWDRWRSDPADEADQEAGAALTSADTVPD